MRSKGAIEDERGGATFKNVSRLTVAFIILASMWYCTFHRADLKVAVGTFLYWIEGLGWWGLVVLLVAYVTAIVLMVPTTLLNLGAGYTFGVWVGFPCMLAGGITGACISFFLGRTLARDCVKSTFGNGHLSRLDQGLLQGRQAFKFVFLSRVPPCMPFPVLNYMYGTTGIEFYDYLTGTAAGLIPGTFLYVYFGHAVRSLVELLSSDPSALGLEYQLAFIAGVTMTVIVTMYLANEARRVGQMPLPAEVVKRDIDSIESLVDTEVVGVALTSMQPGVRDSVVSVNSVCGREQSREHSPRSMWECQNEEDLALDEEMGLLSMANEEPPHRSMMEECALKENESFVSWLSTFNAPKLGNVAITALKAYTPLPISILS